MKCPICKGTGELKEPHARWVGKVADKKVMAILLRKEGYSIRQIMKFLEYKSPESVQSLLKTNK
jgi:hypothetical protein